MGHSSVAMYKTKYTVCGSNYWMFFMETHSCIHVAMYITKYTVLWQQLLEFFTETHSCGYLQDKIYSPLGEKYFKTLDFRFSVFVMTDGTYSYQWAKGIKCNVCACTTKEENAKS